MDDPLIARLVVGRRRADRRDVAAMPGLRHGERAGRREVEGVGQPRLVVLLRAEVQDGRGVETPLHARLDLHARVSEQKLFEARDETTVVVLASELLREGAVHRTVRDEQAQLTEHALTLSVHVVGRDAVEVFAPHELARSPTALRPAAHELLAERGDVELNGRPLSLVRFDSLLCDGSGGGGLGGFGVLGNRSVAGARFTNRGFTSGHDSTIERPTHGRQLMVSRRRTPARASRPRLWTSTHC